MAGLSYERYDAWKQWSADAFMQPAPGERIYFAAELRGVSLAGQDVLEIGFGNGGFLGWAREEGARLYGTELSPRALTLAAEQGVTPLPADLQSAADAHPARFALIAAFDVLEHLTFAEIDATMDAVARLLRPGGRFLARFPNGQSPFGRVHQHADATHVSILSAPIFTQLVQDKPFAVRKAGDPVAVASGAWPVRIAKRARDVLRRVAERVIRVLFGFHAPFGTDTIVLLERR